MELIFEPISKCFINILFYNKIQDIHLQKLHNAMESIQRYHDGFHPNLGLKAASQPQHYLYITMKIYVKILTECD